MAVQKRAPAKLFTDESFDQFARLPVESHKPCLLVTTALVLSKNNPLTFSFAHFARFSPPPLFCTVHERQLPPPRVARGLMAGRVVPSTTAAPLLQDEYDVSGVTRALAGLRMGPDDSPAIAEESERTRGGGQPQQQSARLLVTLPLLNGTFQLFECWPETLSASAPFARGTTTGAREPAHSVFASTVVTQSSGLSHDDSNSTEGWWELRVVTKDTAVCVHSSPAEEESKSGSLVPYTAAGLDEGGERARNPSAIYQTVLERELGTHSAAYAELVSVLRHMVYQWGEYALHGMPRPVSVLLHGPPGTGMNGRG